MFKNMFKYLKMCEQCNTINNYYFEKKSKCKCDIHDWTLDS